MHLPSDNKTVFFCLHHSEKINPFYFSSFGKLLELNNEQNSVNSLARFWSGFGFFVWTMLFEENYFLITCGIAVSQKDGFHYSDFNLETKLSAFPIRKAEHHYITVPWSKISKGNNCWLLLIRRCGRLIMLYYCVPEKPELWTFQIFYFNMFTQL